jgi:aminoglycoside phosphotransferase (APT) family kinase protein
VAALMHDDEIEIDEALVSRLVAAQFPTLSDRQLTRVEPWGTDNAIWRLGEDLVLRLPRVSWATSQVQHEALWLPRLAPHLPISIPTPVAIGQPGLGYPFPWSVHKWLSGTGASVGQMRDPIGFAHDLAAVINALEAVPAEGAPPAVNRALPVRDYDEAARAAIASARGLVDVDRATEIWEQAMTATPHQGISVWVHGDIEGNCLLADGRLSGIVDWGSACVGDPAVDIQVVWTDLFTEESRLAFLEALEVDDATIARSRGAAIQQACAALPYYLHSYPLIVERSRHKLLVLGVELQAAT